MPVRMKVKAAPGHRPNDPATGRPIPDHRFVEIDVSSRSLQMVTGGFLIREQATPKAPKPQADKSGGNAKKSD